MVLAGIAAYCFIGVRLSQWWVGSRSLYGPYEVALIEAPFWVGTGALVLLVVFSFAMRWVRGWRHEWFIVLCASAVAWFFLLFTVAVASGMISD